MEINRIATIYTDLPSKFGLPRQSGLVEGLTGRIVMEKEFRRQEAFRELDGYSHIWLIWGFSESEGRWQLTVRPPRLGGNRRVGVFATRSPFRPNPIGLSCVRLVRIDSGPILVVSGADLVDGTPILDIKPYLAYADSHPDARSGFAQHAPQPTLRVVDDHGLLMRLPEDDRHALEQALSQDPRPHYQHDPARLYTMTFGYHEVRFRVTDNVVEVMSLCSVK